MCGIAGVYAGAAAAPVSEVEVVAMAAMLGHRGPDGHGLYVSPRVGLANTRLAIVDIEGGFQPLCNETRDVWLTFNGEIFNHVELRGWLVERGHRFRTQSDTEVIAHAYEELGPATWDAFNGQFAIGLWDRRSAELWLVRDRIGIHPLVYAEVAGSVVFASEAKAIFAGRRIASAPDPQGLIDTFTRWSATPPNTVFAGIRQVRPGTALRFDADLRAEEHRYWQLDFSTPAAAGGGPDGAFSLDAAATALTAATEEAVRLRLRADVPVAAYLSGGLDSSFIAALLRRTHEGRLDTFGIGFEDPHFDEADAQRRMAAVLGIDHHEILCTGPDIAAALAEVTWHAEQPLLRTAPIPMFLLSAAVAEHGFKVAMTGEGADEWFAGYSIFQEDRVRRFWARDPASSMRPALLGRIHPEVHRDRNRGGAFWTSFFGRGLDDPDAPLFSHLPRWENNAWAIRLLSDDVRAAGSVEASYRRVLDELPAGWPAWSPLARAQALEIQTFLSPYLLAAQGDRVGLGHGVELRYPFLDPVVADFALGLPDRHKLRGLRDKIVLRRAAAAILPREVWERPKQPFRGPVPAALLADPAGPIGERLLSEPAIRRTGLLDAGAVGRLLARVRSSSAAPGERETMAVVGVASLQVWADRFFVSFDHRVEATVRRFRATGPRVLERHPDGEPFVSLAAR